MLSKKHGILCNVKTCVYNDCNACTANDVEISLDNSVIANSDCETKCKTFKCCNK